MHRTHFTDSYEVILDLWFVAAHVKCQYTATGTLGEISCGSEHSGENTHQFVLADPVTS
jgi:hypothetical protein